MSLTLSMIIKNEEEYLEGCLESVKDVVDEIVIVDTGSTDRSKEIAESYGAKIYDFKWIDNFSAARNYALRKSTGDWILYLDADERLYPESKEEIKEICKLDKKLGVNCSVISNSNALGSTNAMRYMRLFRNNENIFFEGKVHEQIELSLKKNNYEIIESDIKIDHLGYEISEDEINLKAKRNLKILLDDHKENWSGYKAFQIGQTYMALKEKEKAIPYFIEAVKDDDLYLNYRAHCFRFIAAYYNEKNQLQEAEDYINFGLDILPDHHLMKIIKSEIELKKNNYDLAKKLFVEGYQKNLILLKNIKEHKNEYITPVESVVMRGIQLSIFMRDEDFFKYFQTESGKFNVEKENKDLIKFVSYLFNKNSDLPEVIPEISKTYKLDLILEFIKDIDDIDHQKSIYELIKSQYQNDFKFILHYGDLLLRLKDYENAQEILEQAFEFQSNNPQILFYLLTVYLNNQEIQKAINLIDSSKELFSQYPSLIEKLESIKSKILPS